MPAWRVFLVAFLVFAVSGGYLAYDRIEKQTAELTILARDLATMGEERDSLVHVRDNLIAERDLVTVQRDQLTTGRDAQRLRAEQAEGHATELDSQLSMATAQVASLQSQLEAAAADTKQLEQESATLRDRVQAAQAESRDQIRAADAAAAARQHEQLISDAALDVVTTGNALSATRSRMINILLDQIDAERAGRAAAARSLVSQYNALVTTHNTQVDAFSGAIGKLRALLS